LEGLSVDLCSTDRGDYTIELILFEYSLDLTMTMLQAT